MVELTLAAVARQYIEHSPTIPETAGRVGAIQEVSSHGAGLGLGRSGSRVFGGRRLWGCP